MNAGGLARLDAPTRARIEAACSFVNHKIGQLRGRVLGVTLAMLIAALTVSAFARVELRVTGSIAFIVVILVAAHAQREIKRWYKMLVIRRVVEALGKGLTYSQESSLTSAQFKAMDLLRARYDIWRSEDQVGGRRNEVAFTLHEVYVARREKRGKSTHEVTVFRGVVVALDFNKHFQGHTVVVPDKEGKLLGGLLGEVESRADKRIVRLPNADFERIYTAYSDNDQEAHYLLTPKLLELVLAARRNLSVDLRLAFFHNSLYVAVPSAHDRFEINLFGKATPEGVLSDLANVVALAEQLIDVLDLETRIWSRV